MAYKFCIDIEKDKVETEYPDVYEIKNCPVIITISGITLENSYLTNLSDSDEYNEEYCWSVEMYGAEGTAYSVGTHWFTNKQRINEKRTLYDMQNSVYALEEVLENETIWRPIGDADVSYTKDSITYTFMMPENHEFDLSEIEKMKVRIFDRQDQDMDKTYYL